MDTKRKKDARPGASPAKNKSINNDSNTAINSGVEQGVCGYALRGVVGIVARRHGLSFFHALAVAELAGLAVKS